MPAIHIPVLLNEAIDALRVEPGGRYIDCTVGEGGHTTAVLERGGRVLGIDIDPQAIEVARARLLPYGKLAILINKSFDALDQICSSLGFQPVRGILFDLGMSSFQLSNMKRGFSFQYDAPLDMRFSPTQELTAATIVNTFPPFPPPASLPPW
jgi:16S rRNA (cytosine1402-N4)-methyltransferase